MAFGRSHTRGKIVAEINVTPLTDIFLVLLIIFMVTSTTLAQTGLNVNLPRSRTAAGQVGGVTVTATAAGLIVAIVALGAYNWLISQINAFGAFLRFRIEELALAREDREVHDDVAARR